MWGETAAVVVGGGWGDGELAGEGRGEESAVLLIRAAL